MDIEYNRTALFKIPKKEYLEYKFRRNLHDYEQRIDKFTKHSPVFKRTDQDIEQKFYLNQHPKVYKCGNLS